MLWLEVRALQAAMFGIPARLLLNPEPLDSYVRRGLLGTDPRTAVDASMERLLARTAAVATEVPTSRIGMRLSGPVSEATAARLYALGIRRFAVDAHETRSLLFSLGRAALEA